MNGKIIAICENMIAGFDQHMADTYDVPSALSEIIARCIAAERTADELREQLNAESTVQHAQRQEIDTLRAQLATVTEQYNTLQEMYRSDHDQRIRQAETIKRLENELRIEAHQSVAMQNEINRLEWTPARWLQPISDYNSETPLGHMLDGLGDEVEP